MINYDTIISAYNDKPTLMEWLKKVEEALKGASATSFSVNKKGSATISFQINFDDGTSLESGEIILQQGESVTGASIVNGHLILTLSNGDNLNAGNLGAVSSFSIDGSQHLIVTYQDGTTNDLGAIFNGNVNITGTLTASTSISTPKITSSAASIEDEKPIIEKMTGYSVTNTRLTDAYISFAKNGNKLTMVFSGSLTLDEDLSSYKKVVGLYVPASVGAALVPNDGTNRIIMPTTTLIQGSSGPRVYEVGVWITNWNNSDLELFITAKSGGASVPAGTYAFRYEVTLLLSPNYAPQE